MTADEQKYFSATLGRSSVSCRWASPRYRGCPGQTGDTAPSPRRSSWCPWLSSPVQLSWGRTWKRIKSKRWKVNAAGFSKYQQPYEDIYTCWIHFINHIKVYDQNLDLWPRRPRIWILFATPLDPISAYVVGSSFLIFLTWFTVRIKKKVRI